MTRFKGLTSAVSTSPNSQQGGPGNDVVLMDGAITIGVVQIPLNNTYTLTNATLTRNAANDVSINQAASLTGAIDMLVGEYFKQANALLSTSSVPAINNSGLLADDSGDTPPNKGTLITALNLAFSIQGASATSFTATLAINTLGNGVANSINTLLNASAVAPLTVTASATTCRIVSIPIPTPVWDIAVQSSPTLELAIVTPASCTVRLYGVALQVSYNFN